MDKSVTVNISTLTKNPQEIYLIKLAHSDRQNLNFKYYRMKLGFYSKNINILSLPVIKGPLIGTNDYIIL